VVEGAHEPEVHLLAEHEVEHLLRVARLDDDAHARVADGEALQDRREDVRRDRGSRAEGEPPGAAALERVHDSAAVGEAVERLYRVRQERLAGLRELHAARRAHEETRTEVLLEPLEARRQRRLGDEERVGGPAYVPRPGDLHEGFDLRQQHDRYSLYRGSKETIW
jgi:hypothetical protein